MGADGYLTKGDKVVSPAGALGLMQILLPIGYGDLSMVISNSPMTNYVISRENVLAHEKVVEEVMKEFTVLLVRFCTIALRNTTLSSSTTTQSFSRKCKIG